MKTKALIVALLAAVSAGSLAAAAPAIRYTSEAPFRDGKPVESVWKWAPHDTCSLGNRQPAI